MGGASGTGWPVAPGLPGVMVVPAGGCVSAPGVTVALPTPSQMPQQAPITPSPGNLPPPPGYK